MAENVVVLDSKNFDKMIAKGNWVVDFWASWCGPCKIMAPHFEAAAKELKGKVNFGKVDAEHESGLAQRFQVMSIPTMILFKDKEQIAGTIGAIDKNAILAKIKDIFKL